MRWTIPNGVIRRQIFVSLLSINLQLGLVGKLRFGLRRGRRREGGESLEGGLGGEVMGLLGRAGPAAVVRRVVHFAVDGYGGAEPQQVGRALAPVGVVRRRPPPLLAQLVQLRLEHCRGGLGTNGPLPIGDSFRAIARSDPLSRLLRLARSPSSLLPSVALHAPLWACGFGGFIRVLQYGGCQGLARSNHHVVKSE